ncbi:hypothetical protein [Rhodococcus sp. UNC363MFTsu5.1]|uniref:hypothetical protein n=1 Tax=Rhodococcus sp. UNC363MFTsu5.1 TaxID=1449069 RepID=UPI000484F1B4|nr:hypothetical protein [Rhodococcus sp. UNC363MFTsu5.1]
MQPLACDRCGNRVLVEKTSWHHTAIQWTSESESSCAEFRDGKPSRARTVRVQVCEALQESIDQAVLDGRLDVAEN